jgi:hypothetical protein
MLKFILILIGLVYLLGLIATIYSFFHAEELPDDKDIYDY